MNKRSNFYRLFLLVCIGLIGISGSQNWAQTPQQPLAGYEVKWVGTMRDVMQKGDLASKIQLKSLESTPHLYAIGPLAGLRGEITVIDSKPAIGQINKGKEVIEQSFNYGAAFLVYTQVSKWQESAIPTTIANPQVLEAFIEKAAIKAGIDTAKPFPFLIKGDAISAKLHVVDKRDTAPHSMADHDKIKVSFSLNEQPIEILGFYSDKHQGVFTHHDSRTHMHINSLDGKFSGHLDEMVTGTNMRLFLPQMQ